MSNSKYFNQVMLIDKNEASAKHNYLLILQDSLIKSRTCTGNFLDIFGGQQDVRIAKCYSDTVTKIENCLPEELKYFPGFVVDVLQSVTQFLRDNMQNFKRKHQFSQWTIRHTCALFAIIFSVIN